MGYVSKAGLAIYEANAEKTSWSFIGKSNWLTGPSETRSFSFDGLILNSSSTYTAIFYGHLDTFNALSTESSITSLSGVTSSPNASNPIIAVPLSGLYNFANDPLGGSIYDINGILLEDKYYTPTVTFSLTNLVPEPSTSSLSLFGLTALLVRRRKAN